MLEKTSKCCGARCHEEYDYGEHTLYCSECGKPTYTFTLEKEKEK